MLVLRWPCTVDRTCKFMFCFYYPPPPLLRCDLDKFYLPRIFYMPSNKSFHRRLRCLLLCPLYVWLQPRAIALKYFITFLQPRQIQPLRRLKKKVSQVSTLSLPLCLNFSFRLSLSGTPVLPLTCRLNGVCLFYGEAFRPSVFYSTAYVDFATAWFNVWCLRTVFDLDITITVVWALDI